MGAPKPRLEQGEFDEAVRTNLEDFGMEPDEAVRSAVEEFELQGYDLSGVVKAVNGGDTDSHPVAVAATAIQLAADDAGAGPDPDRLSALAGQLRAALRGGGAASSGGAAGSAAADKDAAAAALVIAHRARVVPALVAATRAAAGAPGAAASGGEAAAEEEAARHGAPTAAASAALAAAARALRALLASQDNRGAFLDAAGPELALLLLRTARAGSSDDSSDADAAAAAAALAAAAAALAEAAAFRDEGNKCRLVEVGMARELLRTLEDAQTGAKATAAAAGALRALVNADDERSTGSKCFAHARALAKHDGAVGALLAALRRMGAGEPAAAAAVMAALKQIAANDDICREAMEAGGTDTLLALLRGATEARVAGGSASSGAKGSGGDNGGDDDDDVSGGGGSDSAQPRAADASADLARGAAGALRQLANSDAVKSQLAELGALPAIVRALRAFSPAAQPAVHEELLGLLAAMTLRMPAIATAAADAGAVAALLGVLEATASTAAADASNGGGGAGKLQQRAAAGNGGAATAAAAGGAARQACMALRNIVARSPELRPAALDAGAEALVRAAKARFAVCGDVGSAALRDLGLDQYH